MKLNSLELRNFKGIKSFSVSPEGEDLNIYGDNATGKTTIFDGFMWLLFDKDSNNSSNFNIKTLNAEGHVKNGLEHEVKGTIVIEDRIVELQKIYKEKWTKKRGESNKEMTGHETDYFIDGVPKKKKEFTEFLNNVIDEETFRILTNPIHFNTKLDWKKRREVALQLVEDINISEVLKTNNKLKGLEDLLLGDTTAEDLKAKTQATKRKLNKQLEQIPVRIDELSRQEIDEDINWPKLEKEKLDLEKQIKALESNTLDTQRLEELKEEVGMLEAWKRTFERDKTLALNEEYRDINKEIQAMQQEINSLSQEKQKVENETVMFEGRIDLKKEKLEDLRDGYGEISKLQFDADENTCKSCGQELQEDKKDDNLKRFDGFKINRLNKNIELGKATKAEVDSLEIEIRENTEQIKELDKKLKEKDDDLKQINEKLITVEEQLSSIDFNKFNEYKENELKITRLNREIENILSDNKKKSQERQGELETLQSKLSGVNLLLSRKEVIESNLKRVEELKEEERKLAEQIAQLEKTEMQCEQFIMTKAELLEDKLNSKFKLVKFKLFNKQVNGGVDETFVTTVNGVPFEDLNNAMKTNAGLDIIQTLSNHYKFKAPIFLDNREGINEIIDIDSQVINLIVSNDKKLRVEDKKTKGVA